MQDLCTLNGWILSAYEGNPRLPREFFIVDRELDLNVTYLPENWLEKRSKDAIHKASKDKLISDDQNIKPEKTASKAKSKKRPAKHFANVENQPTRRNANRNARNAVVREESDIENASGNEENHLSVL